MHRREIQWVTRLLPQAPANAALQPVLYSMDTNPMTTPSPFHPRITDGNHAPHPLEIHQCQGTGRSPRHRPIFPPDRHFSQARHEVDQGVQPNTRDPRARRPPPADTGILRRAPLGFPDVRAHNPQECYFEGQGVKGTPEATRMTSTITLPLRNKPTKIDRLHRTPGPPGERKPNQVRRREHASQHVSPVARASSSHLTPTENQSSRGCLQGRAFDLAPGPWAPEWGG